jgi:hypothetical protein
MEEAFAALLLSNSALSSLVGPRIRWTLALQNEIKPYIVLNLVSSVDDITYRDVAVISESRVQIDCYALTWAGAKAISRAVKAAINGKGGGAAATIDRVFFDTERGIFEDTETPDKLFRISADYRIFHR